MVHPFLKQMIPRSLYVRNLSPAGKGHVLLTFDDGPDRSATPAILDLLRNHKARAVFFVVGNRIGRAPELLTRILAEGHALGNHSYEHPNHYKMSYSEYVRDLGLCQREIERVTGTRPRLHRPPLGTVSFATALAPKRLGMTTLLWSCSAEDWRFNSDDDAVTRADQMIDEVGPRDILLFHDEKPHTARALARLLPAIESRGLRFDVDLEGML